MPIVNLSAPWIEHYRKLQVMFKHDECVSVVYDAANMKCDLYVDGEDKANALLNLLKPVVEFGNIALSVIVHPSNALTEMNVPRRRLYAPSYYATSRTYDEIHYRAFECNTAMNSVEYAYGPGGEVFTYVIFANEVVQYFADDASDYFGLKSTLYEDIARDIFIEEPGVYYCTNRVKVCSEEDQ